MCRLITLLIMITLCLSLHGQSNEFEVTSQGIVIPRLNRNTIASPQSGQLVYDINSNSFWFYNNLTWVEIKEDNDQDDTNELQSMTVSTFGDTLYLVGGNHIIVPGISDANYIKDGDGNLYEEVEILGQTWLKPNLWTTTYNDGTPIEKSDDYTEFANLGASSTATYGWYDLDSITNAPRYGALYNWFVVDTISNGGKNVCPVGYRVPNSDDLYQLRDTLDPTNTTLVAQHLKSVGSEYWEAQNQSLDTYGFDFRGGGQLRGTGSQWVTQIGDFLSTTTYEIIPSQTWLGRASSFGSVFSVTGYPKAYGYSIRCLKE